MILDANVVNFDALGSVISKMGPELIYSDDPWENFCGTMRYFIRIFRLPSLGTHLSEIERLDRIEGMDREL